MQAWLAAVIPPVAASIDKLSDVPGRFAQVFVYDADTALVDEAVRAEATQPAALAVVRAWAAALAAAPRLTDRQAFRDLAKGVGAQTGAKGKLLFHTIRLACTGAPDGLELDVLIPAIEQAAAFTPADGIAPVLGCRERAGQFLLALDRAGRATAWGEFLTHPSPESPVPGPRP